MEKAIANGNKIVLIAADLDGTLHVTLAKALAAELDSINTKRVEKGGMVTPIPTTSATITTDTPITMEYHHHLSVEVEASAFTAGNFVVELLGCSTLNGTYGPINKLKDDGTFAALKTPAISVNGTTVYEFTNIGVRYVKLRATRTTDGTITVRTTPYN